MRGSALLVLNHRAAADDDLREVVRDLRAEGVEVHVRVSWEDGDGRRWAAEGAELGVELVVAAGGDGTFHEATNGLLGDGAGGQGPLLGLLPFGTGNDFAGALGLDRVRPGDGLRTLLEADPLAVDVGRVDVGGTDVRWFVNVATGGFAARVTTGTPPGMKKLLGGAAYLLHAIGEVTQLAAEPMMVRGPGWEWKGDAYLAAVGNGRGAGGGVLICPTASVRDGLFNVVVVPEVEDTDLLRMLGDLIRTAGHLESEQVWTARGEWVELESEQEIQLNLDGEPIFGRRFRFEVRPGGLALVLPGEPAGTMLGEPAE